MREFVKVLCVVVILFATPAAALAWFDREIGPAGFLRYGCPVLAILAVIGFLKLHLRPDDETDYLRKHLGPYFNRSGFCFGFRTKVGDGVCHLETYFQNQHVEPCIGCVALRPARGFFLGRAKIETIAIQIECGPAAFGIARMAIPVPSSLQGKRQTFEVGASVDYPNGKGRRVRFHDGIVLRANSNFSDSFRTALNVAGTLTGPIVLVTPATVKMELPAGVAEDVPEAMKPEIHTLWKLGDSPLQSVAQQHS